MDAKLNLIPALTLTPPQAIKAQAASEPSAADLPQERVELGANSQGPITKPNFALTPPKPTAVVESAEKHNLTAYAKGAALLMTGLAGFGALTGCTPKTPSTPTVITNSEAYQSLSSSLNQIEESMKQNPNQSKESVAGQVFKAMGDYGRKTGQKGEELMNGLAGTIRSHPALAATIAFTAGTAIGISLDQFGVTDKVGNSAGEVLQWVKDHPVKAAAIGVAVAGAGYLLYNYVIKPMAEVPPKPTGTQAEAMEKTFDQLEKDLQTSQANPQEKAAQVSKTLTEKIKDYAKATGRSAAEVKNDVTAWAYDHPVVATSLVMGAGVATGVILSQAGVPETVAQYAGVALDGAKSGFSAVGQFAQDHPVVAGAVVAGVAAGAGYVIYQAVSK